MSLEEYAETFREIDRYGLLSEEDRGYLVEKGILEPRRINLCCPSCGEELSRDIIYKVIDLFLEGVYKDREKYDNLLQLKPPNNQKDHDSMMFR